MPKFRSAKQGSRRATVSRLTGAKGAVIPKRIFISPWWGTGKHCTKTRSRARVTDQQRITSPGDYFLVGRPCFAGAGEGCLVRRAVDPKRDSRYHAARRQQNLGPRLAIDRAAVLEDHRPIGVG